VVSVTTDGFITNLTDLEERILSDKRTIKNLLGVYRSIRKDLCGDPTALEIKNSGKGILT
jgi:hypothetical protein